MRTNGGSLHSLLGWSSDVGRPGFTYTAMSRAALDAQANVSGAAK